MQLMYELKIKKQSENGEVFESTYFMHDYYSMENQLVRIKNDKFRQSKIKLIYISKYILCEDCKIYKNLWEGNIIQDGENILFYCDKCVVKFRREINTKKYIE